MEPWIFGLIGLFSGMLFGVLLTFALTRPARIKIAERLDVVQDHWNQAQSRMQEQNQEICSLNQTIVRLEINLQHEREMAQQKANLLNETSQKLSAVFQTLSNESLLNNNQAFLTLAKTIFEKYQAESESRLSQKERSVENLISPIKESLQRVVYQIEELEKSRLRVYGSLSEQIKSLVATHEKLQIETNHLVKALRTPTVRGRWGEIQLKRVVEIAGMVEYCDFVQQQTINTENGKLRPDLIVQMPGGKYIVVDAKAPLQAFLEAVEAHDEDTRIARLKDHAQQIRTHVANLSAKSYWEQFQSTPEFVVLFLPGESFFSAALEQDPSLIEDGVAQQVIVATPTTLIALLRAVHYGWKQEKIAQNAQRISELGQQLHERLATMADHIGKVGLSLNKSVEAYNAAVSSLEGRVLSSARKFKSLGAGSKKDIEELVPIDKQTRPIILPGDEPAPNDGQKQFPF